ncbi:hypothetical protein [Anatilimnocola floriformis]|uniref:hypothetical protein n=1 Tax=Anatilimnocola floriformis TaxID=2948575 RepID=UPI0020C1CBBB|nr:hypothetical protein [Anatilimnocola floriformis]
MPEYTHTLIPDRVDFVPEPTQVGEFLTALVALGATPLKSIISFAKAAGAARAVLNPFTGVTDRFITRKGKKLKDLAAVTKAIDGADDFEVTLEGKGPPPLPALEFDFEGAYEFQVKCALRAEVVSTSDWHDEMPIKQQVEFFDRPCSPKNRLGIFHHPETLQVIQVPKAGCARFWIEFEYGKMLFPAIKDRLDLLEPKIVAAAVKAFGVKFVQGCRWCA